MRKILLIVAFAGVTFPASAADPAELLAGLPGPYNAVAVVNTDLILKTSRATKDGWTKLTDTSFLAGTVPLHPAMERIVAVTEFAPSRKGPSNSAALVATTRAVNLAAIAENLKATMTTIADEPIVATTSGSYLVKLEELRLGVLSTGHKPDVARWLRAKRDKTLPAPEKYLAGVMKMYSAKPHIFLAVDLADLFDSKDVDTTIAISPLLDVDKKAGEQIKRFLVGVRGVRISINLVEAGLELRLTIDGSNQPTFAPEVMKEFVIEMIRRGGADFVDLRASVAKNEENDFALTFNITDEELGHLMTLILPPVTSEVAAAQTLAVVPAGAQKAVTAKYVQAVNKSLDDLKKRYPSATDYGRTALWHDTTAAQIEAMSVVGVEPKVVEYGLGTANLLRTINASLRGVPQQNAALQANAYLYVQRQPAVFWTPFHGLNWNPWAGQPTNVATNLPEVQRRQAETIRAETDTRVKIWQAIDAKRSEVLNSLGN